jgi:hypothetical protein
LSTGEESVIRQAISCDICGAEKKQTNHWYVACEQGGEMRIGGWNSRMRQRPGSKHLCGQTCLHKLIDEFMARTSAARGASAATDNTEPAASRIDADASLTSPVAYEEDESSARIIATPEAPSILPRPAVAAPPSSVFPMPPRLVAEPATPPAPIPQPQKSVQIEEALNYSSRRWRAEAWERERNRELRAVERHPRHKGL